MHPGQGNNFVTTEQVLYTWHALFTAGSEPNLSGAQVSFLHLLISFASVPGELVCFD